MEKELRILEEGPKVVIYLDALNATKYLTGKLWPRWRTRIFVLKRFTSIHDWLAIEMNKYIQKTEIPEWMTEWKPTLIQQDLPQSNHAKQL